MVVKYQLYIIKVPSRNLMANDERNFRSSYYEKVGCRSVEEKKSLEILLKDKPWDKLKLKQFCLRFTLPGTYRNLLWKVLLDVLPIYATSHDFVLEQRLTQYKNLMHAVSMMRIVDKSTPKQQLFVALWYLETGRLQYGWNIQVDCGLTAIAETLLFMFDDDEAEVYWLARGFYEIVESFERDIPRLIDYVKFLLEKEDDKLFRYLVETKAFESLPLAKWFNCCFAGILGESALAKIWDKLCGGAPKMLVFVTVVLLVTMRRNILKCKDIQSALSCLQDIPRDTQEVIANKAIELWQHYGSMLPVQNDSHHNTNKK